MSTRIIFRCQYCNRQPDPLTQICMESQLQELVFGQYMDAPPEYWLVWHGRGLYGPARYACPKHREELTIYLRYHYGTIGWHPWKMGPYPTTMRSADTDKAVKLGGKQAGSKWSFGPKIG